MTEASILDVTIFSLIGGVISLLGGVFLLQKSTRISTLLAVGTPFAAGALLAAVFLDLLPEGIKSSNPDNVLMAALFGMIGFFIFERATHWFHHHHSEADNKRKNIPLIIVGDTLHNALDGVVIASGFLVSVPTGIVTTIAVAAHEIPQEIADFGLLLSRGVSRKKVLLVNLLSALATVTAAIVVFTLGGDEKIPVGILLGLSAGFLLYIAASDIIPSIHEHKPKRFYLDTGLLYLLLGTLTVGLSILATHEFSHSDSDHDHESSLHVDE